MRVIRTNPELARALQGTRPAFVPTMGALHQGHLALIRRAQELATSSSPGAPVVVSIFVNPTQFGPNEDYARYPRMLENDVALASSAGAQIAYAPEVEEVYPNDGSALAPRLPAVATEPRLEDAHRPTHFAGVCQVVARLFDLVDPAFAVFGEKDYQQLMVIRAMVEEHRSRWDDLEVVAHPTIREPDGLAMSSRNAYLTPSQRSNAIGLKRALDATHGRGIADAEQAMHHVLSQHHLQIDYAVVRDASTLMPMPSPARPARALIAARVGNVRLIDNAPVQP
jgi:pantoate--beta-alanine ligase